MNFKIGKYLAFCKLSMENTIVYRGPIMVWVFSNFFSLVAIVSVWLSSSFDKDIGGYSKPELITYYVAALFLQWLVFWFPFDSISREIKDGEIILSSLIKPISFFWRKFAEELGWHLVSPIFGISGTLILALLFKDYLIVNFSLVKILLLILTISMATFLTFIISLCQGLLAFWFTEVSAVDSLYWMGRSILGGQIIPISFIPGVFQTIVRFLPFRYMFSFPLEIYFGRLSSAEVFQGIMICLFWILLFYLVYLFMWERGRKSYTSFGQ